MIEGIFSTAAVETARTSFVSGGAKIGVESFLPAGKQKVPAIIVLHGAGGMESSNQYVRQLASGVAASGYGTFLVEYFDRTGTSYAGDAVIGKHSKAWLETIGDAVRFASEQPRVDARRLGIFGYSLGGYLAVAHAAHDPRIRAVAEIGGGIDPEFARTVKRLPPLLIVHGTDDQRVPFARAVELEEFARTLGGPLVTEYLEGERHIFSPGAALGALVRTLEFYGQHLR